MEGPEIKGKKAKDDMFQYLRFLHVIRDDRLSSRKYKTKFKEVQAIASPAVGDNQEVM